MKKIKKLTVAVILAAATISVYSLSENSGAKASNIDSKEEAIINSEAQLIREKMLNAIDHYSYVKGSFLSTNSSGDTKRINFEVQQGKNPGSYVTVEDQFGKKLIEKISDENVLVTKMTSDKTFTKKNKVKWSAPSGPRKGKAEDGNNIYIYRQDPSSAGYASEVTFPQEVAFWIDDEEKNVTSIGHTTMFGRDATIIKGSMLKSMKGKAEKFAMYVDTKTGILLGLETTRDDGTPGMSVKVEEIVIDQEPRMTASSFDTSDPVGYTEIKPDNIKQMVEEKSKQAIEEPNK